MGSRACPGLDPGSKNQEPPTEKEKVRDHGNLNIPLAPLEEQTEIVRRVELLFKLADKIEKLVEVELSRTEKMTQAILAKAFRGELVPTEAKFSGS